MKKFKKNLREHKKTIIIFISLILFLAITFAFFNNKLNSIDTNVHNLILNIRTNKLTDTMTIITNVSSAYSLIVITILLFVIIKNKRIPLLILINLLCSFIVTQIAKIIFRIPRPEGINLIEATGYSYPSGHSMVSMAYFGFIGYLIYKKLNNKIAKIILLITLMTTIILIGFSRIYLGVHYLSDVIGGFLLSISYLVLYIKLIDINKVRK